LDKERTALGVAAAYGQLDVVRFLLKSRVQLKTALVNGSTPLISAATKGHRDVVTVLLENGADINAMNLWGEIVLLAAVKSRSE